MALLEQIEKMKQTGQNDAQIAKTLKEQGYSMTQVNDTLSQLKIKSAIYGNAPEEQSAQSPEELQPSIMQPEEQIASIPSSSPQGQGYNQAQPQNYTPQYSPQADQTYVDQQQGYAPQDYNQQGYYSQVLDIETVRDISRQETEELIKSVKKDVDALNKIKTNISFEIQNLDNRLNKIEAIIQELQSAIIRKMGEYGESIQGISEEVRATQNAFSKMVNPILDKQRSSPQQASSEEYSEEQTPKKQKISKKGQQ